MSSLTPLEKIKLEKLLAMASGYVLDFSNRTFQDFILETTGIDIYQPKYADSGDSKANRLRAFWKEEDDPITSLLLGALFDCFETMRMVNGIAIEEAEASLLASCREIVLRLAGSLDKVDVEAIKPVGREREYDLLAKTIRESIANNEPELALDRLHTYMMKYLRDRCSRIGLTVDQTEPLHSLLGKYIRSLPVRKVALSTMSERILKSAISHLEAFNDIRNTQSLAHDNRILGKSESMHIFKNISSLIQLVEEIDPLP